MTRYFICTALIFTTTLVGCHSNRDTDPMLAEMGRKAVNASLAQINDNLDQIRKNGLSGERLDQINRAVRDISYQRNITLSSANYQEFEASLQQLIPVLQSLVFEIAEQSSDMRDFLTKYSFILTPEPFIDEGKVINEPPLVWEPVIILVNRISRITGRSVREIRWELQAIIRNRTILSPSDKAIAAQAAARLLVDWGYSERALANPTAIKDIIEALKDSAVAAKKAANQIAASAEAKRRGDRVLSTPGQERLVAKREAVDTAINEGGDVDAAKEAFNDDMKSTLVNLLGSENVTGDMTPKGYQAMKEGGDGFEKFVDNQRKDIAKRGNIEVDRSKLDKITAELIEGGLTQDQIQRLLKDTSHYFEVQQCMAELNYALEEFKDYAEVEAAGGIQAIVDRKVEQTKAASE